MDFQKIFKDAWSIIRLDEAAMKRVAQDKEAFQPALVVIAFATLLNALSSYLFPTGIATQITHRPGLVDVLVSVVLGVLFSLAYLYFSGWVASLFKSKLKVQQIVNVAGHAYLAGAVLLIPRVGALIFAVWFCVVLWRLLSRLGQLEPLSVAVVVFAPFIIGVFLAVFILSSLIASYSLF